MCGLYKSGRFCRIIFLDRPNASGHVAIEAPWCMTLHAVVGVPFYTNHQVSLSLFDNTVVFSLVVRKNVQVIECYQWKEQTMSWQCQILCMCRLLPPCVLQMHGQTFQGIMMYTSYESTMLDSLHELQENTTAWGIVEYILQSWHVPWLPFVNPCDYHPQHLLYVSFVIVV